MKSFPLTFSVIWSVCFALCTTLLVFAQEAKATDKPTEGAKNIGPLRVGGYVQNIDPLKLPVPVNGGFVQQMADQVIDPLAARTLVIAVGDEIASLTIVDSCLVPRDLIDDAKSKASQATGIPVDRMLVAATHAHSVPAVQGIHGSEASPEYRDQLREQLALSIIEAHRRLRPAEVGWAKESLDKWVYCRRWLMKPGTAFTVPFTGRDSNQVQMNPGHTNPNRIRPVGPVDTDVMVLAFRDLESGRPLAVLGNFNTHYAGAAPLSSDYFGHFCRNIGARLQNSDDAFVALMSNGTSGDANCIDFSQDQAVPFNAIQVAEDVMSKAVSAYEAIDNWSSSLPLQMVQNELVVAVRVPSDEEVARAREATASWINERLPQNVQEVYARETILLSEMPTTRTVVLQALRLGDFSLTSTPCEVYGSTGLHLKQHSPFPFTMNIGWANDYLGYLPPPDHFELGGYTTWRARSSCLEINAEPKIRSQLLDMLHRLRNPQAVSVDDHARKKPVTPHQSLGYFTTDAELSIQLVAGEPQVIDPVAIAFDDRERMWVVEMRDYPTGPVTGDSWNGTIKILTDQDHDGFYESAQTFAQGLAFPTGILPFQHGVIVTLAGKICYLADKDDDGVCDTEETWFTGFAEDNEQLRANDPTLTMAGMVHIASGLRGGSISPTDSRWEPLGAPLNLATYDFEFDPFGGVYREVGVASQFGFHQDRSGNDYVCSNRNPCKRIVVPRSRKLSAIGDAGDWTYDVIPAGEQSQVLPLINSWTTSHLHAGQFTSACSVFRYESDLLNPWLAGNYFACEPTSSLVTSYVAPDQGIAATAHRSISTREFLASTDPWFRPVYLADGPEGAIYIVDMHRAIIEHPQWVPDEWKSAINQRWGNEAGRIYRLVPRNSTAATNRNSHLHDADLAELVATLGNENHYRASTAGRLILQQHHNSDEPTKLKLGRMIRQHLIVSADPATIIQCLWLLHRLEQLPPALVLPALHHQHPDVRWNAVRLAGRLIQNAGQEPPNFTAGLKELFSQAAFLSSDTSLRVRFEWLINFASIFENATPEELADIMDVCDDATPEDRRWLANALAVNSSKYLPATFSHLTHSKDIQHYNHLPETTSFWLQKAGSDRDTETLQTILDLPDSVAILCLAHFLRGSQSAPLNLSAWLHEVAQSQQDRTDHLQRMAIQQVSDHSLATDKRLSALEVALVADPQKTAELCLHLVKDANIEIQRRAMDYLVALDQPDITLELFDRFSELSPSAGSRLISTTARRPLGAKLLVTAIADQQLPSGAVDPATWNVLKVHADKELRSTVVELMSAQSLSPRADVVRRYLSETAAVAPQADISRGEALFRQHCAACHKIDGFGFEVGPNISDLRVDTPAKIIEAVFNPNAAIDAAYFRYTVLTLDGRVIDGLMVSSDDQAITLMLAEGQRISLSRDELEATKFTGQSMMPEGFENQISPIQMADLVKYLKEWRLKDATPVTSK